jgi:hypothetical protein
LGALRGAAAALGLLALGACSSWPPPGAGGFAEHRAAPPPEADAALARRLACSLDRFAQLRAEATQAQRLTGRAEAANETANRARREFHAGLQADAARSLDRLEAETAELAALLPGPRAVPESCT